MQKLQGLNPMLTYHRMEHTIDVVSQAERIAKEEGVREPGKLRLLKIAALYHDTGFLHTYAHHEERSCEIFLADAPSLGLDENEQQQIVELIMATKIPQNPVTHLQQILCDADLDYLGRSDFFTIGNSLKEEFLHFSIIKTEEEWLELQARFLSNHHYHTKSSRTEREHVKKLNIQKLNELN